MSHDTTYCTVFALVPIQITVNSPELCRCECNMLWGALHSKNTVWTETPIEENSVRHTVYSSCCLRAMKLNIWGEHIFPVKYLWLWSYKRLQRPQFLLLKATCSPNKPGISEAQKKLNLHLQVTKPIIHSRLCTISKIATPAHSVLKLLCGCYYVAVKSQRWHDRWRNEQFKM